MKKIIIIEFLIIFLTLVIVLPLALTTPHTYVGYKSFEDDIVEKALTFDLIEGQTVNGSITLSDYARVVHGLLFYFPNGSELGAPAATIDVNGNFVTFNFTSTLDGEYYVTFFANQYSRPALDYSYSVGPSPTVLGIQRTMLICIALVLGVVSALTVAVWSLRHRRLINLKTFAIARRAAVIDKI